jgi:glc operon protein GlcG
MKLSRRKRVATAQTPVHKGVGHYGPPITLDQAKKGMAAAEAKVKQNNWNVVISIVDSGGHAVMLQRLDGTQLASIRLAEGKARTAVEFRRPTKALEDVIAGGGAGLRYFTVLKVNLMEGGVPIVIDGKIVGGIGVSGVDSKDDAQIAQAGADAVR